MTTRTRNEIWAEVEAIAEEVAEEVDAPIEEIRAAVFEEFPDLYAEWTVAPAEPLEPIAKAAPPPPTVADAIVQAVHDEADRRIATRWPTETVEGARARIWESPEGEALYSMYKSEVAREPYHEARHTIGKSLAHVDAWAVLNQWLD